MKQFIKQISLLLVVLATTISANAYDFQVNGIYYGVLSMETQTCQVVPPGTGGKPYQGNVVIPSEVTYKNHTFKVIAINSAAFSKSKALISVTIPNSITNIEDYTFNGCERLQKVALPETIVQIGNFAFSYCVSLTSIAIPSSVKYIGVYAFDNCYNLQSITITNDWVNFRANQFENCNRLSTVVLRSSVTKFNFDAFAECANLKSIKSFATNPPSISGRFNNKNYMEMTVYVPQESLNAYKTAEGWKNFWNIEALK